jgi:hypothetical protein
MTFTRTVVIAVAAFLAGAYLFGSRPQPPAAALDTSGLRPLDFSSQAVPVQQPPKKEEAKPADKTKKAAAILSAAAIAALLVQASRQNYYATGHPCACPDDVMRNGRRCGSRSAYSRPGGASPLCYVSDITSDMIEQYRQRTANAR